MLIETAQGFIYPTHQVHSAVMLKRDTIMSFMEVPKVLLSFFHHLYFNIIKFNKILTFLHFL
jgi:hypothetical protein